MILKKCKSYLFGTAALLAMSASSAMAGGLWLYEMGQPDMGTATAGRAALARDASTAFTNPAGMTRLDRSQVMLGLLGLDIDIKFSGQTTFKEGPATRVETAGNGHDAGSFTPAGSLNYVHVLTRDLRLGFYAGSYFGLAADYGDDWQGRYYAQRLVLETMALNPSVAYRVNDWLSVGGGATALYGKVVNNVAINNHDPGIINPPTPDGQLQYDATDWGWGFNAGILLEPAKTTRIGLTYRSAIDLNFGATPRVTNLTGPISARISSILNTGNLGMDMTIPQTVEASCYQQVTDQLALMANVGWQDWSQFGQFGVDLSTSAVSGSKTIDTDMQDTWHGAIGAHYRVAEPWLLMAGFAYDSSPIKDQNRSVALPLDRQIRYAGGVEYSVNKDLSLGADYTFIDLGEAPVNKERGPLAGRIAGQYNTNHINAFGLNMNYKF